MQSGIYSIKQIETGKVYIGSSVNIKKRISNHKTCLKYNKHDNKHLQKSYNKYGLEYFEFKVVEYCEYESLVDREVYWILKEKSLDPVYGYNFTIPKKQDRPLSRNAGKQMPQKTKNKISKYFKENIHHSFKGTKEEWLKVKEGTLVRYKENYMTPEEKEQLIKKSDKSKKVYQVNKEGVILQEFESISEAARQINNKKFKNVTKIISDIINRKRSNYRGLYYFTEDQLSDRLLYINEGAVSYYKYYLQIQIYQYDLKGNLIDIYDKVKDINKAFNVSKAGIKVSQRCNTNKTYRGFLWKRKDILVARSIKQKAKKEDFFIKIPG